VTPPFQRRFSWIPRIGFNADRIWNRFRVYPNSARRIANDFDAFHIVDHSYAQLVDSLPAERTGVYCHDLDAFRCLLDPRREPRPRWFRSLARTILRGLQHAALVFHSTQAVREQLLHHQLVDPTRLIHAPYGVSPEFTSSPLDQREPFDSTQPRLVHVGSCIPRKRIEILLQVFSEIRRQIPGAQLIKVSGEFTRDQQNLIQKSDLARSITHHHHLTRIELAQVYHRASVVMMTSDSEGFGLPVIEALACGAPVVASAIPALQEAGGIAASYAPVADIPSWETTVLRVLKGDGPSRDTRLQWASQFTWKAHAETIAAAYHRLIKHR
jgi:glycosyltransferase involved in cell wall biosynthesis